MKKFLVYLFVMFISLFAVFSAIGNTGNTDEIQNTDEVKPSIDYEAQYYSLLKKYTLLESKINRISNQINSIQKELNGDFAQLNPVPKEPETSQLTDEIRTICESYVSNNGDIAITSKIKSECIKAGYEISEIPKEPETSQLTDEIRTICESYVSNNGDIAITSETKSKCIKAGYEISEIPKEPIKESYSNIVCKEISSEKECIDIKDCEPRYNRSWFFIKEYVGCMNSK